MPGESELDSAEDFSALAPRAAITVALSGMFAALGTLTGLAGLLMSGIKAFAALFPEAGDAPILMADAGPYFTVLDFALTVVITLCGVVNLLMVLRWQDFLGGEWRRYLLVSAVGIAAAILFLWTPDAV